MQQEKKEGMGGRKRTGGRGRKGQLKKDAGLGGKSWQVRPAAEQIPS
jgi:hypothetical protein